MFSFFQSSAPKPFAPVIKTLPQREPCSVPCNNQSQSPFFSLFPAEIRNEIYGHCFESGARELLSVEAHPLSMLLTCHKANHEATNLAFRCHTFDLSDRIRPTIYISLRFAISHLSSPQVDAMTAVSYDQRRTYLVETDEMLWKSKIISNAILVFPNLKTFEFRNLRGGTLTRSTHHHCEFTSHENQDRDIAAIQRYAPRWFMKALADATNGYAYAWQTGHHWKIAWPQLKDANFLYRSLCCGDQGEHCYSLRMTQHAIGVARGVEKCPCLCADIEWTSADLVQETGRIVAVNFVYYGPELMPLPALDREAMLKARSGARAVILREGALPLDVVQTPGFKTKPGAASFAFDASDELWESTRRRSGDLRVLCRDWWRTVTNNWPTEDIPGSRSWGEGDWARGMKVKESSQIVGTNNTNSAVHGRSGSRIIVHRHLREALR
jgi:hypothetical protein